MGPRFVPLDSLPNPIKTKQVKKEEEERKETPLSLARQSLHRFLGRREPKLITHMKAIFTCVWE